MLSEDIKGKIKEGEETNWAMNGHELVSRVLTAPYSLAFDAFKTSPGMQEIKSYLNAIRGTSSDPWGGMVNESCGLHVHVARSPPENGNERLPLPVLQHLAYLLVRYEDLITSMHPASRRATRPSGETFEASSMIGSNLMGLRRSPHLCQRLASIDLVAAQKKIFSKYMTPKRLANLMDVAFHNWPGGQGAPIRYKFVNFERLRSSGEIAMTIEFRQHEGTLDFDVIAHWVHFILSLVRAAGRMAVSSNPLGLINPQTPTTVARQGKPRVPFPRQQGNKYMVRCAKLDGELENMFRVLDFEDEELRSWWTRRFCELNPNESMKCVQDQDGKERIVVPEEECPACHLEEHTWCASFEVSSV